MVDYSKLEEHNDTDFDDTPDSILPERDGTHVGTIGFESALDRLKRSVEQKEKQTITYPVPDEALPGLGGQMELEFSTQITTHELQKWRKASKLKGRRGDEVDGGKMAGLMLAEKSLGVLLDGKRLTDEDGDQITLRSDEILGLTGSRSAADGVRRLLGDGVATSMSDALGAAAGYGDDFEGNPT